MPEGSPASGAQAFRHAPEHGAMGKKGKKPKKGREDSSSPP